MVDDELEFASVPIETERDLRASIREINRRFNARPEIARLLLVNPILAMEDLGVRLSPGMRDHVMRALRFPPKQKERVARLERDLQAGLRKLGLDAVLPLDPASRARLLFEALGLRRLAADREQPDLLGAERTGTYASKHPLVATLAEYERARQGSLVFQPRAIYEEYKAGRRKHRWLKAVRFRSGV